MLAANWDLGQIDNASERIPGRARGVFQVADIGAEP
jgi:hypothetical protein